MGKEGHTPETEARLHELCEVMRNLDWERGKTGAVFAAKWGISESRMGHLAAEAWKRVQSEATDVLRVTTKVSLVLERTIDEAYRETREPALIDGGDSRGVYKESPNGARRVVVEAAKTWAALIGANAATRVDVTTRDASPAKARAAMRAAFGDIGPQGEAVGFDAADDTQSVGSDDVECQGFGGPEDEPTGE